MQTVLLVIHVILAVSMIGIILIQRSEGGGLGMGGRSDAGLMTARGQANLLTRTTAILAALFFLTSLALFILSVGGSSSKSLFNPNTPPGAPTTTTPTAPAAPGATPAPAGTPAPAAGTPAPPAAPAPAPAAPAPAAPNAPAAPTK